MAGRAAMTRLDKANLGARPGGPARLREKPKDFRAFATRLHETI
jgi:hypothetical protein